MLFAGRSDPADHRLVLPEPDPTAPSDAAALVQAALASAALLEAAGPGRRLQLETGSRRLAVGELRQLERILVEQQLELACLISSHPHTHVAAAALGLCCHWPPPTSAPSADDETLPRAGLQVHQGTLRSGDHLQADGAVLVLGDVNPGARVSAGGHVLVWGRLRGIAHAGCRGDREARIVALQLRPLQLRIADAVARGPEGTPPAGLAEEARIVAGVIQIDPAQPGWPVSG